MCGFGSVFLFSHAYAKQEGDARFRNAVIELNTIEIESGSLDVENVTKVKKESIPEEHLAEGEMLFYARDYPRAAVVLTEIIEKYPDTPSQIDALWLRGETYYGSKEYLAARRDYRALVFKAAEERFQYYLAKALARLIDVSVRTNDLDSLEEIVHQLGSLVDKLQEPALFYARGKGLYLKQRFAEAAESFRAVPDGTSYAHQARYFEGLIALKAAPPYEPLRSTDDVKAAAFQVYRQAIAFFQRVTQLPADTAEQRQIVDLAWMAIGRLFYQMESFSSAIEAYSHIARDSLEFATMLYEIAWVFLRSGDLPRAERALEILAVSNPDSGYVGDGTLLHADILLRDKNFDQALKLYESVRMQYDPMRIQVEDFLTSTTDIAVYYQKLSQRETDSLEQKDQLPPLAIRWAREGQDGKIVFSIVDDMRDCQFLIKQSQLLIEKLNAVLNQSGKVHTFPSLRSLEQRALSLTHRVTRARLEIAGGIDSEDQGNQFSQVQAVRSRRRALMSSLRLLPTTAADFDMIKQMSIRDWSDLAHQLSVVSLEIEKGTASLKGLNRFVYDGIQNASKAEQGQFQTLSEKVKAIESMLIQYRARFSSLRREIEKGQAQLNATGASYQMDSEKMVQFRELLEEEVSLMLGGQSTEDGKKFAAQVVPLLSQASKLEKYLLEEYNVIEDRVRVETAEFKSKLNDESVKIAFYSDTLRSIDNQARDLLGRVAERNLMLVRDKLRGIVLRADVGITEQSWEVREDEIGKLRGLQLKRSHEEKILDEELREVLDEGEGEKRVLGAAARDSQ
ncbi:hypothetical protein BCY86_06120 [Pajaroellobacter abortibovis]|uniref:Uncharacterized protein n=2 Tax=Pajaroellobacter abortibovis TaxID=1882918 RepID=A0A1L6MZG8_9BACT|nr:hypothetical protein BCY86_06120 [Pajaroellobacter abortibovis]